MGQKRTLGMHTGVWVLDCSWVLGNCLGVGDICVFSGIGAGKSRCADGLWVISEISGTLPGMLFLVCQKCIHFVSLRVHFAVWVGTAIMGGASVICCRGAALAWWLGFTLCSTLCSGWVMMGTLCRSPEVRAICGYGLWVFFLLDWVCQCLICFWYCQVHWIFLEQVAFWMLWQACQSPLGGACSTLGTAPGNVGGTIWRSRIFGMHASLGWKSGCIGSGLEMDWRTMHQCLCFPTNLVFWGIHTLLSCNLVGPVGSNSNYRGCGRRCTRRYLSWCAMGASCSIGSQLGELVGPTIAVETCCRLWNGRWWNASWKSEWHAWQHWHGGCVFWPKISCTALHLRFNW